MNRFIFIGISLLVWYLVMFKILMTVRGIACGFKLLFKRGVSESENILNDITRLISDENYTNGNLKPTEGMTEIVNICERIRIQNKYLQIGTGIGMVLSFIPMFI